MNADAVRHLYTYHFAENRRLWDRIIQLSPEAFIQDVAYSLGSVRNQIMHLIIVDDVWFSDLRGEPLPEPPDTAEWTDYERIRAHWDAVERKMKQYLDRLQDEMLSTKPLQGEDADLVLWQVLLHVINHGTDHRAQILRLLHDFGVETSSQDYVFFAYEQPVP